MQVLLVSLLALMSLGVNGRQDAKWTTYSAPDGSFSAAMPDEPKTTLIVTDTAKGRLLTHVVSATDKSMNEYLVSWTEYDKASLESRNTAANFDRVRDALVASKGGKVQHESALTIQGVTARAVSFTDADGRTVSARFLFAGNRFYQVMAEARAGQDSAAADRFLESFKVRI